MKIYGQFESLGSTISLNWPIPRAMQNYFDILGLETGFALNEAQLEKAYFAAQRKTHPDLTIGKPEAERVEAFLKSQLVNEAYEALKSPLARAEHLLALQGIAVNSEEQKDVPAALLMEMMELRERLEEAAGEGVALAAVVAEIKQEADNCTKALTSAFAAADYTTAAAETVRMAYLGKAMEEAHMLIYRMKALHS
jgi:molecular chaperone HscB